MTTPTPAALKAALSFYNKVAGVKGHPKNLDDLPELLRNRVGQVAAQIDHETSLPLLLEIAGAAGELMQTMQDTTFEHWNWREASNVGGRIVETGRFNKLQSLLEQLKKGSE